MSSLSLSFSQSIPHIFKTEAENPKLEGFSRVLPCIAFARAAPSSPTRKRATSTPKRTTPPGKHRLWKVGEHPGVSDASHSRSLPRSTPLKNVKKKIDDRNAAKGWASTVTEALSEKIQKKQWEAALEIITDDDGIWDVFTVLLDKMKTLPLCQPDVFTYSTLLKACVEMSRFELVDTLFQEMSERLITPSTVTQNIVLGAYGKAGKFDKMEEVLSGMLESSTCKPDVWTMNIILSLFGNKGQIETMEKWYEKFRSIGIEPETRTFNILIGAYGKKQMYDKMTAVMEYMRKMAFPWTTSTYNNVIEAFADVGNAKNMEYTFNQMCAEKMKADTKTFCCLIKGYGEAGLYQKVVSSVQMAEKLEISANTSFYNALISACTKANDLMEMERVFNHMKNKKCEPDSTTPTRLQKLESLGVVYLLSPFPYLIS
ncbi:hypothetical protein MRB53_024235 [Persea americana]|uniref:Uncharacterized protein n=1 Tax=Persea americana TaxID=3435 RepID=A0ACC2LBM4_PERAE|nr:hypothetical protein MRB53_024235 [Persea americana]